MADFSAPFTKVQPCWPNRFTEESVLRMTFWTENEYALNKNRLLDLMQSQWTNATDVNFKQLKKLIQEWVTTKEKQALWFRLWADQQQLNIIVRDDVCVEWWFRWAVHIKLQTEWHLDTDSDFGPRSQREQQAPTPEDSMRNQRDHGINTETAFLEWQVSDNRTVMIPFAALKPPNAPTLCDHRIFRHSQFLKYAHDFLELRLPFGQKLHMWYYDPEMDENWDLLKPTHFRTALGHWNSKLHIPLDLQIMTVKPNPWQPRRFDNIAKRVRDAMEDQGAGVVTQDHVHKRQRT